MDVLIAPLLLLLALLLFLDGEQSCAGAPEDGES